MAEIQPENMKGTTLDIAAENRARLKQLFPTVFTETRNDKGELTESIDFAKLQAELGTFSDTFESCRERYGMEWPGKKEALHLIQTLSSATLKPCRQESVNFDTTENLFIEGDNLEVLKLLQTSYYGKVKMIYIDPPYNTGKEFVYPDNFSESLETYLEYAGLIDGDGKKFSTNTANEGRFHTKWLNMMYPRLYLARNLLRDDGVMFISIDDNEVSNLRKLCDEVFGEENFVAQIAVLLNPRGRHLDKFVAKTHESVLVYVKDAMNDNAIYGLEKEGRMVEEYNRKDERGKYRLLGLRNRNQSFNPITRPKLYYPLYVSPRNGKVSLVRDDRFVDEVWPDAPDGIKTCWTWGKDKVLTETSLLVGEKTGIEWRIYRKDYLVGANGDIAKTLVKSVWTTNEITNDYGRKAIKDLFGTAIMDFPKSTELLKTFIHIGSNENDLVLDFFAGSATTAHAVLDLNRQDNGNRKFILVQLPEPCAPESEAFKAGYKTIADIGKERIRRVINKLNTEQDGKLDLDNAAKQDRGFKVLKLDKSNFRQWQKLEPSASTERILDQLVLHIDHIDAKATPEELLYEILLKAGFTLTGNIETKTITGKELFSVSDGALLLCLEESVTKELIDAVIDLNPQQFLCLDSAFHGNDQLKANAVQTFNAHNMQKEKHNQILFKTV